MMNNLFMISNVLIWIILIIQLIFMYRLTKTISDFLARFRIINGRVQNKKNLTVGKKSPVFKTTDQNGNKILFNHEFKSDSILIFTKPSCSICEEITKNFSKIMQLNNSLCNIFVVGEGINSKLGDYKNSQGLFLIEDIKLTQLFEVEFVPYLIVLNKDGEIKKLEVIRSLDVLIEELNSYYRKTGII